MTRTRRPLTVLAHIEVPPVVIAAAKALPAAACYIVTTGTCCGYPCVLATVRVPWHTDSHMDYRWSLLWAVRNDVNATVQTRDMPRPAPQPVGTLLLLQLQAEHRLFSSSRSRAGLAWAAMCWDMTKRRTKRECLAVVAEFLLTVGKIDEETMASLPDSMRLSPSAEAELREIQTAAKVRHEKARKAAKRRGRLDFPDLPYECSWAYEEAFRQRVSLPSRRAGSYPNQ